MNLKSKTLLLESYRTMYNKMQGNTMEKHRIGKLIAELEKHLGGK
jgi:hypothetical protein